MHKAQKYFQTLFDFIEINELVFQRTRPEIRLFYQMVNDITQRNEYIYEAIKYMPRPLILYNTTVDDVKNFMKLYKKKVINLQQCFMETSDEDKLIFSKNGENELEIIATSAFGMGRQLDVRSVIHCCYPESFQILSRNWERWSNNSNSISLFLPTPKDKKIAKGITIINNSKILGKLNEFSCGSKFKCFNVFFRCNTSSFDE